MLEISAINTEKLRQGQFLKELPELFELKNFIENNSWHNNDSVFNHTLAVVEELEKLLKSINNKINSYLNQKINNHTKKELLFLGALFHDIAKSDTLVRNGDLTLCPNHEEAGSEKVKTILNRFDLSEKEKAIMAMIIKCHGEIHIIVDPKQDKIDEKYKKFELERHDILIELALLAMADILGSQLKDNNLDNFNFRTGFYKRIIDNFMFF